MDPIERFSRWLAEAKSYGTISEPTAMTLATASSDCQPSARIVLLKHYDQRGFVFYTNLQSRKGRELLANPKAALCFYWMELDRQVRIEGSVEQVSGLEADEYFNSRPRDSRLGAWASLQSETLSSMDALKKAFSDTKEKYEGKNVPRPPHWSGWRVVPQKIEFWQEGDHRLHERELFERVGQEWTMRRLYP